MPLDPFDLTDEESDDEDVSQRDEGETVADITDDSGILDSIEKFICDAADLLGWDNDRAKREIRKIMDESF